MDLLSPADIAEITSPDHTGPAVSLFMPTHRHGPATEADQLGWKNLVNGAAAALADSGLRTPEVDDLLAPARSLQNNTMAWQHMSDGLVMFLRPGWERTYRLATDVPQLATVGDRFVVGPLVRLVATDDHFLVLTLSQRTIRLLEGNRFQLHERELSEVPTSLRDVIEPPEKRSDTMTRPVSRGGARAVFYGHGAADDDFKSDQVDQFMTKVAKGLNSHLANEQLPMVVVGLSHLVGSYRNSNTYGPILDEVVQENPDPLDNGELHARAWPVIEQELARQRQQAIERFNELAGTGRTATDALQVETAARDGRVETLFMAIDPWCWDRNRLGSTTVVRLGTDPAFAGCEALDKAAVDTLATGGEIFTIPAARAPGGGQIAAILRY